jgi:transcriptional regulator with PAS, ATPase and Fis domain
MRALLNYDWEGNIRELENVIERAIVLGEGELITLDDLPQNLNGKNETLKSPNSLKEAMQVYERQHIIRILEETASDKKQTADILQIGLSSLYRKIEELEIPGNGEEHI